MGLDSYLERAPRYKDTTMEQIRIIDEYMAWEAERSKPRSKARKYSFSEWTGIAEEDIPTEDVFEFYKGHVEKRYPAWDWQHKYPSNTAIESVAYWRNAYHIHKWFVNNVQHGIEYGAEVTEETLRRLLDWCIKAKRHPEKASFILPTSRGEYDDYYFQCIDYTIDQITGVLETTDFETHMVYYVSN